MGRFNAKSKILIVGAGVSGLALAQILRKHGVNFEIFERDEGNRRQGWALGLDKCLDELRPLLPNDLDELRVASPNNAIGKPDTLAFINPRTHELLGVVGPEHGALMLDRNLLRQNFMQHLHLHTNKQLTHYEQDQDGVTAYFRDCTNVHGAVLIGADGSNSRVRRHLIDGSSAVQSRAIILHGEVILTESEYELILKDGTAGVLYGEPGLKGLVMLSEWLDDGRALFNWNCAWLSSNLEDDLTWAKNASAEALFEKAKQLTKHLPEYIKHAVQQTGPAGMLTPPIRLVETVLPVDVLRAGQVTLVGDSAHSMVPFQGMGANTALIDACELATAIIDGIKYESDIDQALRRYEQKMIPRGRKKVLESRETAESQESFDVSGGRLDEVQASNL